MKSIFKNTELNNQFLQEGFVTVPLISEEEIKQLIQSFHEIHPDSNTGFYASLFSSEFEKKKRSDELIKRVVEQKALEMLNHFQSVVANYVIKYPGKDSIMHPHQDWCFVNEAEHCSINIWIPLTAATYKTGSLHLLKNSHRLPRTYRGTQIPSAVEQIATQLDFKHLQEIEVPPGTAIFYDHRMIHASPANLSDEIRIAAAMVLIPQNASLLHYVKVNDRICSYAIDSHFFYKFTYSQQHQELMNEYKVVDAIDFKDTRFQLKELIPPKGFLAKLFNYRRGNA